MPVSIEVAAKRWSACGEGPVWDADRGLVYWVDILGQQILTTDFNTLITTEIIKYSEMIGATAYRPDGGLVAAVASGFVAIGAEGTVGAHVHCLTPGVRMNDAKTDKNGNLWAGSCAYDFAGGYGGLWKLDESGTASLAIEGLTQPNGMGWSPDGSWFYLVETQARVILKFPFDADSATVTNNPVELIGAANFLGYPDGLTVDTEGNLWIAEYAGGAVHRFSPNGDPLRKIAIPTTYPTSCAFVGPNLDQLWVTSAATDANPKNDPLAGSSFLITGVDAVGIPATAYFGSL